VQLGEEVIEDLFVKVVEMEKKEGW